MSIAAYLREGARTARFHKKLLLVYYVVNLAAAAVIIAPVALLLSRLLGHSLESVRLFGNFDPEWLIETGLRFNFLPAAGLAPIALLVAALFLVTNTFLAGGVMAVFYRPSDSFFAGCARYFPRFFRLFLLSMIFYGLAFAILNVLTRAQFHWAEESMREGPVDVVTWGLRALLLLLLFAVNMTFDYAKIICVVEDRKAFRSTGRAIRFVARSFASTYGLFLTTAVTGLVFAAIYLALSEWIGQSSMTAVVLLFFVRQLYIAVRFAIRLWTWGSELALFRQRLRPAPEQTVVPVERSEPAIAC